ncbi:hypothetical protein [Calidifontibacter terrae]
MLDRGGHDVWVVAWGVLDDVVACGTLLKVLLELLDDELDLVALLVEDEVDDGEVVELVVPVEPVELDEGAVGSGVGVAALAVESAARWTARPAVAAAPTPSVSRVRRWARRSAGFIRSPSIAN